MQDIVIVNPDFLKEAGYHIYFGCSIKCLSLPDHFAGQPGIVSIQKGNKFSLSGRETLIPRPGKPVALLPMKLPTVIDGERFPCSICRPCINGDDFCAVLRLTCEGLAYGVRNEWLRVLRDQYDRNVGH